MSQPSIEQVRDTVKTVKHGPKKNIKTPHTPGRLPIPPLVSPFQNPFSSLPSLPPAIVLPDEHGTSHAAAEHC